MLVNYTHFLIRLVVEVCMVLCRYLVLEHVSGGELFDYLVKRGRLMEKEVCVCVCVVVYSMAH